MTEFIHTQNSFANGEIAPEFYLNKNINGLSKLENIDVMDGGGLTRRPGLVDIATLTGPARIFSFDLSDQEHFIVVLTNYALTIYSNNSAIFNCIAPWPTDAMGQIQFAARGDSMIFVHPDVSPYVLVKTKNSFALNKFSFYDTTGTIPQQPMMTYDDMNGISINVSGGPYGVKSATFTTNADYWSATNVETIIKFNNQTWKIIEFVSKTVVYAVSTTEYTLPNSPITSWTESAFDNRHGWPCAITFHQDRLVFGGTHYVPGGIWMSRVGAHNNFDVGTGLDDEAIITTLLSKERQQICSLISSDTLQVLTSCGEWAIANKPITPASMNIMQHTSVGSATAHCLIPQKIEGETVFVSNTMTEIRKLSLDTLGEKYNADDLCAFSKHLINQPVDIAYNKALKKLYLVNNDGTMAVLKQNSVLGISAWAKYLTYGKFTSVAVSANETFVVLKINNIYKLSKFSDAATNDSGTYNIDFCVSGVPLSFSGHRPAHLKIHKINLRLFETKSVFINNMRVSLPNEIYSPASPGFSGDITMNMLGSQIDTATSPWTIHGNDPMPITVFSVSLYGQYEI